MRDLDTLLKLRNSLCTSAKVAFPAYMSATMVQRKVKHTTTGDIYALGYAIVNQMATKDMDKIFSNKSDLPEDTDTAHEVTELAELVLIVLNLRDKVKTLENEVTVLQGDNADLRMRLEEISAPVALTAPGQLQPHPQRQTTLQTTAATADSLVPPDGVATDLTPKFPQQSQDTRVEEPHRSLAESSSSSDSESSDSDDSSSGSEVYIPVRRKSGRNRKTKQAAPTRELSAAKINQPLKSTRHTDVYVGGVSGSNSTEDIKQHMAKNYISLGLKDIKELASRGNWKSFRVTVPTDALEKVTTSGRHRMWPRGVTCRPFTERPQKSRATRQGGHANSRSLKAAKSAGRDTSQRRRRPQPPTSRPSSGTSRGEPRDQPQESEWPPLPRPGQHRDWSHFPRSSRYEDRPVWPTYHSDHPAYYGQHSGARGDPSAGYPERWNTYPGHCERCYCC